MSSIRTCTSLLKSKACSHRFWEWSSKPFILIISDSIATEKGRRKYSWRQVCLVFQYSAGWDPKCLGQVIVVFLIVHLPQQRFAFVCLCVCLEWPQCCFQPFPFLCQLLSITVSRRAPRPGLCHPRGLTGAFVPPFVVSKIPTMLVLKQFTKVQRTPDVSSPFLFLVLSMLARSTASKICFISLLFVEESVHH